MSDVYKGSHPHDHIGMGEEFIEHHGVMGMKWGVRRYQSYTTVPRKSGKSGAFKKSGERPTKEQREKAKVSKWQSRENTRVEHEYSKSINKYEKLANKYLDKYDAAKPSRKEGYAKSYVQAKNYANIERGKLSAEKGFIKNATISDIKHERNQLIKGAATCAALSGVMGVVSAGTMLPVTILVMPKPSAIKTANRIDNKQQKSIEAKAAKTTAKSTGSTSKEIQRQYQEDLKRRRRAIAESQRAAQRAAQSAALQNMSLGASGGTNPFMFGM